MAPTTDLAERRDAAILLDLWWRPKHCAMFRELLKSLPLEDQKGAEMARVEALQRVLQRLRAKGLVDRTGNVWSLVDAGADR